MLQIFLGFDPIKKKERIKNRGKPMRGTVQNRETAIEEKKKEPGNGKTRSMKDRKKKAIQSIPFVDASEKG